MAKLVKLAMPLLIMMVSACQQEKGDLNTYVADVRSRQHSDIAPIPVMKPYEKFTYAAAELRDPFVPTVVDLPSVQEEVVSVKVDNGIHPEYGRLKEALEAYSLTELVLVGTLEQESDEIWGLVRAPDGIIHRVQSGNYIGQNHGKILTVSDAELTLKEIVPDGEGGFSERDSSLSVIN